MRNLIKRIWIVLAAAMLMSGCATIPGMKDWWTLHEADFRELRPGESTRADAIRILGTPYQQMRFANLKEEVWDYVYPEGIFIMLVWVYFDDQGTYRHYTVQRLHPSTWSAPD